MKTKMLSLTIISLVALSAFSIAEAMTAEKVIENMIDSYERQMRGVEDYTLVTDKTTTYFKRTTVEGRTTYKMRSETEVIGKKSTTIYDGVYFWQVDPASGKPKKEKIDINPYAMLENLKAAQVKYAGTEKIDGHETYILSFKDLKMIDVEEMQNVSGKFWVDTKDWIIRKMEMDMEPGKVTTRMEDFRNVNGMLIPYRTVVIMPVPVTPGMTPEMRKMMESMMRPQVTVVKDVKVNTGLSDELFDGSKLR